MELGETKHRIEIEKEDDKGQFQQVSGGFGATTNELDEEALKILAAHQEKAEMLAAKYAPVDQQQWEIIAEEPEYVMESQIFDYEILKQSPDFYIKNYNEAVYKGEL